ncbi:HK97 family phage prohead protease [Wenxinia marina]|uniref:Phage prohead protease, HK97 family n=1 Tax=Wenxinia marina DSM 24838 TaxID=1123501 RepID=A0A0D0Q645_9RHOB|nr:HK97 family phage prohead protease [Wenxinia marina]KIQ69939.1 phage prohead protease, HK97 family [Wenxinia marina DSM 24838]GGL62316.1 peptidase U35 [Wenxinia marina]
MELEYKFAQTGAPVTVEDGHRISGYASLWGAVDGGGDAVERGAYAESLKRLGEGGGKVRMLWQHDPREPIGVWDEVTEDARGLKVSGRLLPDVARAREAAALVQAGAIDGLSIGYRTVRSAKAEGGGRRLIELELWEVSLVTFPMLREARVGAKGADAPDAAAWREMARAVQAARAAMAGRD